MFTKPSTGRIRSTVLADGITTTYSRASGETVAGGRYQIVATLAPMAARTRSAQR